jgi:hypothetical protein
MSDNATIKNRRFWQLHLSTLMILSVETSLLVLLNISNPVTTRFDGGFSDLAETPYGWPIRAYDWGEVNYSGRGIGEGIVFFPSSVVWDALICLCILFGTAFVVELAIRCHEGGKVVGKIQKPRRWTYKQW